MTMLTWKSNPDYESEPDPRVRDLVSLICEDSSLYNVELVVNTVQGDGRYTGVLRGVFDGSPETSGVVEGSDIEQTLMGKAILFRKTNVHKVTPANK